jgi:hypothetical protein
MSGVGAFDLLLHLDTLGTDPVAVLEAVRPPMASNALLTRASSIALQPMHYGSRCSRAARRVRHWSAFALFVAAIPT